MKLIKKYGDEDKSGRYEYYEIDFQATILKLAISIGRISTDLSAFMSLKRVLYRHFT